MEDEIVLKIIVRQLVPDDKKEGHFYYKGVALNFYKDIIDDGMTKEKILEQVGKLIDIS